MLLGTAQFYYFLSVGLDLLLHLLDHQLLLLNTLLLFLHILRQIVDLSLSNLSLFLLLFQFLLKVKFSLLLCQSLFHVFDVALIAALYLGQQLPYHRI